MTIDSKALEMLQYYSWPGNIRQLAAVIKQLLISTDDQTIYDSDLPELILLESDLKHCHEKDKLDRVLAKVEKEYIIRALKICKNSKAESARYLGIARSRLYRKLEEYNIGNHNVVLEFYEGGCKIAIGKSN